RWETKDYPRNPDDAWLWDQARPHVHNGWLDLRIMDDMCVAQGAGVGGGSLIYANGPIRAGARALPHRGPGERTYQGTKPHHDRVGRMLNLQTLPENQLTERYKLMRDAATALGFADRFRAVPLAVSFNPDWTYALPDPFSDRHSKTWINAQGQQQGTCVHCGN